MADPVTLAMMGAAAGAVTNKKDPLKGALLGATLGYGGGALAPSLLGTGATTAASGAAGAAGMTSGLPAATGGLLGSSAPLMSGGASPVASTLAAQGLTSSAPLMSTPVAAPSMMSKLTPQTLMAGASLANMMSPQQQAATPLPLRQAQQSQVFMGEVPKIEVSPIRRQWVDPEEESFGIFDTPAMRRDFIGPDRDYLLERIPSRRVLR